jgi:hypothetical protein
MGPGDFASSLSEAFLKGNSSALLRMLVTEMQTPREELYFRGGILVKIPVCVVFGLFLSEAMT